MKLSLKVRPRILYLSNILEIHLQRIEELEERLDAVVKLQGMMDQRMRVLEMKLSDIAEAASSDTENAEEIAEDEDEEREAPEVAWPQHPGLYYVVAERDGETIDSSASVTDSLAIILPEGSPFGTRVLVRDSGWRLRVCDEAVTVPKRLLSDLYIGLQVDENKVFETAQKIVRYMEK